MEKQKIIAIGREFGSGGHEIGEKIAAELGINFYDREFLSRAAKDSGIGEDLFELFDERPTESFLFSLAMDAYSSIGRADTYGKKIVRAEFETLKMLAERESFVIIGRCAEYILRDNPNMTAVFVYGDMKEKKQRIMTKYNLTETEARKLIISTDNSRAAYHNMYCDTKWGNINSYDLLVNSSVLGIDNTVNSILNFIRFRYEKDLESNKY